MFRLAYGVSEHDFYMTDASPEERGIRRAKPQLHNSDTNGESSDDGVAAGSAKWSNWQSGEAGRDAAKMSGHWPDGKKVGRGHGQPYLKPKWARAIRAGRKCVVGRPDEGVRGAAARAARARIADRPRY